MDFSKVIEGMRIKYIGTSWAFEGYYTVVIAESTYLDKSKCPEHYKGKLGIIELMNDDSIMFFTLDNLKSDEWELLECIECDDTGIQKMTGQFCVFCLEGANQLGNHYDEYMDNKYGKETMEKFHQEMDKLVESSMESQFDNLVKYEDIK